MTARSTIAICAAASLLGCVSYQDTRTPEEQKQELHLAGSELVGTYNVTDSRKNRDGYTKVVVTRKETSDDLSFVVIGPKSGADALNGKDCTGWRGKKNDFASVMCNAYVRDISFIHLSKYPIGDTVKDGAVIPSFEPMPVPNGSYLFEIAYRGGSSRYFVLAKQPS